MSYKEMNCENGYNRKGDMVLTSCCSTWKNIKDCYYEHESSMGMVGWGDYGWACHFWIPCIDNDEVIA